MMIFPAILVAVTITGLSRAQVEVEVVAVRLVGVGAQHRGEGAAGPAVQAAQECRLGGQPVFLLVARDRSWDFGLDALLLGASLRARGLALFGVGAVPEVLQCGDPRPAPAPLVLLLLGLLPPALRRPPRALARRLARPERRRTPRRVCSDPPAQIEGPPIPAPQAWR